MKRPPSNHLHHHPTARCRGDGSTDRTYGQAAVEDIRKFVAAGVTTLDTADHYGPSEALIGRYLAECSEEEWAKVQVGGSSRQGVACLCGLWVW